MMDGRVGAIRTALESEGYVDTAIMAYARNMPRLFMARSVSGRIEGAAEGRQARLSDGPGQWRRGLREVALDIAEGADMVMVKPGLPIST